MNEFKDKVAVITGAASGIGRGLAERAAREGMKVVLADVEDEPLQQTAAMLDDLGAEVLAVQTDVSKLGSIESMADEAYERFGAVHLLFNNAGVGAPGRTVWQTTVADWEWVLGVNLWGVIHGVRTFVPRMLAQGGECHIVNTSSIAGLTSSPWRSAYAVSKHSVVTLSEMLHHELRAEGAEIGVSVLCPNFVETRIQQSRRNRPVEYANAPEEDVQAEGFQAFLAQGAVEGIPPAQAADIVFRAIADGSFYILTRSEAKDRVKARVDAILNDTEPSIGY